MAQALYRKYRSRNFDEVVGQEHVTETLKRAIKSGRISHAYLFSGPHGVGKTSVARILAHEVNGLPYSDDDIHLDIIEIDAASNRRIDEIRELRERVHVAPASAKYKVYIIDEVHMLTREAFNALLKTLEEPPAHCIFILATTEAHKLPETIISRTQRFSFQPVASTPMAEHLRSIAKREKIDITPEALQLLADFGNGSFRDSISLLDQLSGSRIDESQVRQLLGLPPDTAVEHLRRAVDGKDSKAVLENLESLRGQGIDAALLAKQLSAKLRQDLLSGNGNPVTPALLKELLAVPTSPNPYDYLEISLLEAAANGSAQASVVKNEKADELAIVETEAPAPPDAEPEPQANPTAPVPGRFDLDDWPAVLERAKDQAGPLYNTLRLASPELSSDTLSLHFKFPLHHKKMTQAVNIELLGKIIEELTGVKLRIKSLVSQDELTEPMAAPELPPLENINNIFGSAEVLES